MRTFSNSEILEIWERGVGWHPLDRGLLALSRALSSPIESLADWPLGRRNRSLFELHCLCFGPRLESWVSCAGCGQKLEFEVDARELIALDPYEQSLPATVAVGDDCFRLPASRDLAQVALADDDNTATIRLLERCRVTGPEPPVCSEAMLEQAGEKMASADPLAEVRLALHCPACDREWDEALDIAAFVWAEIDARARRLLCDVHALASAYGWTESEALALTPARRAMYLEMVQA